MFYLSINHLMDVWAIYFCHTENLRSDSWNIVHASFQLEDNNQHSCLLSRINKITVCEQKIPLKTKKPISIIQEEENYKDCFSH